MEPSKVALQRISVAPTAKLFVSLELSNKTWRVAASDGGTRTRHYSVKAGDALALLGVIERARERFGLPKDALVLSCYEAGRDGFWLHRILVANGIRNYVVDAGSMEVNRRMRRAKTDRLDNAKLLSNLMRCDRGEKKVWSVLRVPSEAEEDARRPQRERGRLLKEQGAHVSRMKSLLVMHNVRLKRVGGKDWAERLEAMGLPANVRAELEREGKRLALVQEQIRELEAAHAAALKNSNAPAFTKERRLQSLRAMGPIGPWVLTSEVFGWRSFNNRRELVGSVGLCGSPYNSGDSERDQGISKAGNRRVRALMVELAWSWLKFQPDSTLSKWYQERFGRGARSRRIGIVALARRLLIALWRYVEHGVIPQGAKLKAA